MLCKLLIIRICELQGINANETQDIAQRRITHWYNETDKSNHKKREQNILTYIWNLSLFKKLQPTGKTPLDCASIKLILT